jgi:hypothetical protein
MTAQTEKRRQELPPAARLSGNAIAAGLFLTYAQK